MHQQHLADYRIAVADLESLIGSTFSPSATHEKGTKGGVK
jgi:hypothetical protein